MGCVPIHFKDRKAEARKPVRVSAELPAFHGCVSFAGKTSSLLHPHPSCSCAGHPLQARNAYRDIAICISVPYY